MIIAIGNDHAGTAYKFEIIKYLKEKGYEILNFGTGLFQTASLIIILLSKKKKFLLF